jgi:hypothetical protein
VVAFQNVFRAEMHHNNIFFKLFFISVHQNDSKYTKKKLNFCETRFTPRFQIVLIYYAIMFFFKERFVINQPFFFKKKKGKREENPS